MHPASPTSGPARQPAVAGRFYPGEATALRREVEGYLAAGASSVAGPGSGAEHRPLHAIGVVAPHAGYVYSGGIAGKVFAAVTVPERVIVLCPNHTGRGRRIAVANRGTFALPGASVPVDADLADRILAEIDGATADWEAHRAEHAIEVELPFLLARRADVRIVPVVLGGLAEDDAIALGLALHRAAEAVAGDVLVVASSDMSHYLPDDITREQDAKALAPLLAFDARGLYRAVIEHDISMCGFIPATAMLAFAGQQNAGTPALVGYATSGDAFGERDRVVGYAGVVVPAA
jgi:AmmeMemoRadiSam system protein B